MNTYKRTRASRLEYVLRSLLGMMLMAAVAWAWVDGGKVSNSASSSLGG